MSPIVRGNKLLVLESMLDHHIKGDHLWVASRKKNGWMRVKNSRTNTVTSLRVGPGVKKVAADWGRKPVTCPPPIVWSASLGWHLGYDSSHQPPTFSTIDQLIRKNQVDSLERQVDQQLGTIDSLTHQLADANKEQDRLRDLLAQTTTTLESRNLDLVEMRRQIDDLTSELEIFDRGRRDLIKSRDAAQAEVRLLLEGCELQHPHHDACGCSAHDDEEFDSAIYPGPYTVDYPAPYGYAQTGED